jgi:hypothetical protein
MKWIYLTLLPLFFFGKKISAQHCEYDYTYIIVLNVQSEAGSGIIPGLKITALDSNNKPIVAIHLGEKKWLTDTLQFLPNQKVTTGNQNEKVRFWFADNNYVLAIGNTYINKIRSVRIEDVDGNNNGGLFQTTIVPVNSTNFFPLCTNASRWDLGKKSGFVKGYAPKIIRLKKK